MTPYLPFLMVTVFFAVEVSPAASATTKVIVIEYVPFVV